MQMNEHPMDNFNGVDRPPRIVKAHEQISGTHQGSIYAENDGRR